MKYLILPFLLLSSISFGQVPKAVINLLGKDFIEMPAAKNYPLIPESHNQFYPSWTDKGDTTGASNGQEFLLFEDSITFYKDEQFKFFKTNYVTNADWQEFTDRVVDSICRLKLYLNVDPTSGGLPKKMIEKLYVLGDDYYAALESNESSDFFTAIGRAPNNYEFDWRKKIDPKFYTPLISDMTLSQSERFLRQRTYDQRKWNYRFKQNNSKGWIPILGLAFDEINVSTDQDVWAANSKHAYDMFYNLSHYYRTLARYKDEPVVGVLGTQIKAYLEFIEERYQKQLNKSGLPYIARVSLPSQEEIDESGTVHEGTLFGVYSEERNLTEQWQITNQEYAEFIDWVEDSISRELIFRNLDDKIEPKLNMKMLDYTELYYDEGSMEWMEVDLADVFYNRELFNLNKKFNWRSQIAKEIIDFTLMDMRDGGEFKRNKLIYNYTWLDYERRSQRGDLEWTFFNETYSGYESKDYYAPCRDKEMSNGVRRNESYAKYILKEQVFIYPGMDCREHNQMCEILCRGDGDHSDGRGNYIECGRCVESEFEKELSEYDFKTEPKALVKGLTYHQALAFYNWKYQHDNVCSPSDNAIYEDLVPSEEEFKKAQAGETMLLPEMKFDYPTPVFRYVVHFYKK